MNMHWESHDLALPRLPKGMMWEPVVMTGEAEPVEERENIRRISPRSITMFIGVPVKEKQRKKSRKATVEKQ